MSGLKDDGLIDDLTAHLDGIVHFADGFAVYHDDGPVGRALHEWINGARAVLARAASRTSPEAAPHTESPAQPSG